MIHMKRDYRDPVYKRFRLQVLTRDKFTCKMCGAKGKKTRLNVHHIHTWAHAGALRYEASNGITLCYACHKSITGKESHYVSYFLNLLDE